MNSDSLFFFDQGPRFGSPRAIAESPTEAFAETLHRIIVAGGLSLEREVRDWLGPERVDELLTGTEPTLDETAIVGHLETQLSTRITEDRADLMEPIMLASPNPSITAKPSIFANKHLAPLSLAASTIVSVVAITIAGWSTISASSIRADAIATETFSANLVTTLANELPQGAPSPLLEQVASDALAYFEDQSDIRDPHTLREWSRLFTVVGRQRWNAGDTTGGREALQAAVVATERGLSLEPKSLNAKFDLSQSVFWLASFHYENGNFDAAEQGFDRYATLTQQLYETDPERPLYQAEYAYGHLNTAIMDWERGRVDEAIEGFTFARDALQDITNGDDVVSPSDVANARAWRSDALYVAGRFAEAINERQQQIATYNEAGVETRRDTSHLLNAMQNLAIAHLAIGEVDIAEGLIVRALGLAETVSARNPEDLLTRQRYLELLAVRVDITLAQDRLFAAKLVVDEARQVQADALEATDRILYPRQVANIGLLAGRVALRMGAPQTAIDEANASLRVLQELDRPDIFSALMIAESYELIGEGDAALGRPDLAQRSWQQGLQSLHSLPDYTIIDVLRARLMHRTGDVENSLVVRARSLNAGYAHPLDTAFWEAVDLPSVVQRTGDIQTDDG